MSSLSRGAGEAQRGIAARGPRQGGPRAAAQSARPPAVDLPLAEHAPPGQNTEDEDDARGCRQGRRGGG